MKEFFDVTLLAILQGVAEFLPISSSGHLVIGQHLLGLDIPGIFAFYNKSLGEGNIATAGTVEQREYRRARKAFLTTYDKSIERMRQADHCINCGECLTHCPQSIQIPQKMQMIEDYTNKLKDSLV